MVPPVAEDNVAEVDKAPAGDKENAVDNNPAVETPSATPDDAAKDTPPPSSPTPTATDTAATPTITTTPAEPAPVTPAPAVSAPVIGVIPDPDAVDTDVDPGKDTVGEDSAETSTPDVSSSGAAGGTADASPLPANVPHLTAKDLDAQSTMSGVSGVSGASTPKSGTRKGNRKSNRLNPAHLTNKSGKGGSRRRRRGQTLADDKSMVSDATDIANENPAAECPDGVVPVFLKRATQTIFHAVPDIDVSREQPFRLIGKNDLQEDLEARSAVSDFFPLAEQIEAAKEVDILLVYDADRIYGENFFLCLTAEARKLETDNWFVYTGTAGFAYMFLRRYRATKDQADLDRALDYFLVAEEQMARTNAAGLTDPVTMPGILVGYGGVYFIGALLMHARRELAARDRYLALFIATTEQGAWPTTELLFGRAGALHACVELNKTIGDNAVPQRLIDTLVRDIERVVHVDESDHARGLSYYEFPVEGCTTFSEFFISMVRMVVQPSTAALRFVWRNNWLFRSIIKFTVWMMPKSVHFVGAGHGLVGIEHTVLLAQPELTPDTAARVRNSLLVLGDHRDKGNYPMALTSIRNPKPSSDPPVLHWCHGAPGVALTLALAAQRLGEKTGPDPALLSLAQDASALVWDLGLLRKGNGICHGVSGNGYVFLTLYRVTLKRQYHEMAVRFAQFSLTSHADQSTPDAPYSLFEGTAGQVCFLLDVLQPDSAAFPFYEV